MLRIPANEPMAARLLLLVLLSWAPPACQDDLGVEQEAYACDQDHPCAAGWLCGQGVCAPEVTVQVTVQGVSPVDYPELYSLAACSLLSVCYVAPASALPLACAEAPWPVAENRLTVDLAIPRDQLVQIRAECRGPDGLVAVARGCPESVSQTGNDFLITLLPPLSMGPTVDAQGHATALATPRLHPSVAELPDGRVLVAGGRPAIDAPPLDSAELYDPHTGSWTVLQAHLQAHRAGGRVATLGDGTVAIFGGQGLDDQPLASVELFFADDLSFAAGPPLEVARSLHTATATPNGSVLVVGGTGDAATSFEFWSREQGSAGLQPLNQPRWNHTATRTEKLFGGDALLPLIIVAGGEDDASVPLASAEFFDLFDGEAKPTLEPFCGYPELPHVQPVPRVHHSAADVPPLHHTYFFSGRTGNEEANELLPQLCYWDAHNSSWQSSGLALLESGRWRHTMTLTYADDTWYMPILGGLATYPSGSPVLVQGMIWGRPNGESKPPTITYNPLPHFMQAPRWDHDAVATCDGRVLVVGGLTGEDSEHATVTAVTEVFNP